MIRWLVVFALLLNLCGQASSGNLPVIHDSGRTRPLEPLLSSLLSAPEPADKARQTDFIAAQPAGPADLSALLPIHSPGLSPGKLDSARIRPDVMLRLARANVRPFFLVGSDSLSLRWLASHRDTLAAIGAMGLLVQAETTAEIRRVAEAARGLPLTPGAGSDLAAVLGIDRYPVLITSGGLVQ